MLVNLSIGFSKEVQLKWFDDMQQVFARMEDIETRIEDIAVRETGSGVSTYGQEISMADPF